MNYVWVSPSPRSPGSVRRERALTYFFLEMPASTARFHWTNARAHLLPKVKAGLAIPVIMLLVIGFLCFRSVSRFSRDTAAVAHTHELLGRLAELASALKDIDSGTRDFVLTGDGASLQLYFAAQETLQHELKAVARMTADPRQQQRVQGLAPLIQNLLGITAATIAERKAGDRERALVNMHTGRGEAAQHRLRIAIQEIQDAERSLLQERRADAQRSGRVTQWIIVLSIVCALVVVALAGMIIHRDITVRHRAEEQREAVLMQLREALTTVKTLTGLLPICAWCKNIRDDQGYWKQLEEYIHDHTDANFTHGICPVCIEKQQLEMTAMAHAAV